MIYNILILHAFVQVLCSLLQVLFFVFVLYNHCMVSVTATVVWYRFLFLCRIELAGQVGTKVRFSLNIINYTN
jgi:hypothetical protein